MNYWIWFASIKELGPVRKLKLLEKFKSPEKIYFLKDTELLKVEGINRKIVDNINTSKDEELLKKYEAYILKNNIKLINIFDDDYPESLRKIYAPPITLFAKGDISLLKEKSIGIVGCREPSTYGMHVAKKFAMELSKNDITIISGMAKGIDTAGHLGAIEKSGKTIAVLGCGIDIIYPKENYKVYTDILINGLIISEYIVGTKPEPSNFPQRNRIISGLSNGVLVVEAKQKSGSMITTDFALEQGKELYVIPGNITSATSGGTNNLIKEGAKLVTEVYEILEGL